MATTKDSSFTNSRDQRLFTRLYEPPSTTQLKAILIRHHGIGDYSQRANLGNSLFAEEGYAVWVFDMHGHGHSEPTSPDSRFCILQFQHLLDDAAQFVSEVVNPWRAQAAPLAPVLLCGASLGGLVTMHLVGKGLVNPDGLILSAAAAGIVRTLSMRVQEPFAALLNWMVPRQRLVAALSPERLCVSPETIQKAKDDALLNHGSIMICSACSVLDGVAGLTSVLPEITCPVLMIHGALDITCDAEVAQNALKEMSSRDKTWVLLPEAKHDLELDLCQKDWRSYVLEWMDLQVQKLGRTSKAPTIGSALVSHAV